MELIVDKKTERNLIWKKSDKKGVVIWFTGLSGAGKTTVAESLKEHLTLLGKSVSILDGDTVRGARHRQLGFSRQDIRENNRLIALLASNQAFRDDFVLVPVISPYRDDRAMAREIIGSNFVELSVTCELKECMGRDPKGLYQKAKAGEINNMIGLSDSNPYESSESPDIDVDTQRLSIAECVDEITNYLKTNNIL